MPFYARVKRGAEGWCHEGVLLLYGVLVMAAYMFSLLKLNSMRYREGKGSCIRTTVRAARREG